MTDWDDAYANTAYIPGADALLARLPDEAQAYRASGISIEEDIAYGAGPRQRLDLIWPEGSPKGLAVFVHGGYWMRLFKSDWSHFAEGARASGWAVAVPGYTLTPQARIAQITQEMRAAIACAAQRVSGPIRVAGHSAGGHLVSRLACTGSETAFDSRIEHILSISGLHDLRPLMHTQMNQTLGLDLAEARSESAALQEPKQAVCITAWVGGAERPEFIRQAQLLGMMWRGFDVTCEVHVDGGHDHFSVVEGLKEPGSAITQAFVGA